MKTRSQLVALAVVLALASTASAATTNQLQRWVYLHTYLNTPSMFQFATNLLNRMGAAGYTGVVLADSMLETTNGGTASYNTTYLQPFLNQASNLGINVVPLVFSFGHSESSIVNLDKNLAEPQPVIGARFTVSADKQSLLFSNSLAGMVNTNFETHSGNSFMTSGWGFQDAPGIRTFADTTNFHSGACSLRIDPDSTGTNRNARAIYRFGVQPWRQYHVRVFMQMTNFSTTGMLDVEFNGYPSGQACNFTGDNGPFMVNGAYPANQGWTNYDFVCNSATNTAIDLIVGVWNTMTGHVWIDDVSVEEVALVNLVRRTGAPLRIYNASNTNVVYSEPADVNTVSDPAIASGGPFSAWHTPPSVTLPAGTSLTPGQQVKMDFYAVNPVNIKQVGACLTAPGIAGYMSSNIVALAGKFPANVGFYFDIDELRHLNTCASCTATGQTAGGLLAWHIGQCTNAIRSVKPNAPIYLCSDMYDPYHNAISNQYYFAGGPVAGSWTGVTSDLIVMNWNHPNNVVNTNSLNFFASRGNKQFILGYYDSGNGTISASNELKAAQGVAGFQGLVYTSWLNNQTNGFAQLENYAAAAAAPTLTAGPASLTVNPGQLATFTVSATAPPPLTYQWQRNATDIAGATNASYSFTTVAGDNGAQLACRISDYGGWVLTDPATLTVNQPPGITSTSPLSGGTVGASYSQALTASGGRSPYNWSLTSGALPNGLGLGTGGIVSGTPTATGTFYFTAQVTDAVSLSASSNLSLVIAPAMSFGSSSPPAGGTVGAAYSQTLTVSGGTGPFSWSVTAGVLPGGLLLSSSGVLSGTPTTAGVFNFTAQVTDSAGATAAQAYTLTIGSPLTITTTSPLSNGVVGVVYSNALVVTGGTAPCTWSVISGALPGGLTLGTNGLLSGTPTTAGMFNFTAQVADAASATASSNLTLTIDLPLALLSAVSRKVHSGAGIFDLPLTLDLLANPTVEPRQGGPTQILFTFNKTVTAADGALSANEFTLTNATYVSASIVASNLTLNLTNVVDQSRVTIGLGGIADLAGNPLAGTNIVRVRALYGDINQSGAVTIGDMQAAKNNLGRTLTATNFLCDVNLSGSITIGDMQVGKNMLSHTISLGSFGPSFQALPLSAMTVLPSPAVTLGEALGEPALAWSSNGDEVWSPTIAPDGSSAAWSGSIGDLQVSWVETMVAGPGMITFQWKVSSELNGDFLTFSVDRVEQPGRISGEVGWQTLAFAIPSGTHWLTWTYAKNRASAVGLDAGWLRRVSYQRSP